LGRPQRRRPAGCGQVDVAPRSRANCAKVGVVAPASITLRAAPETSYASCAFEDASCTLREALTIVDLSADPATFLQTASPEQVAAYQRVAPAVAVLDRLSEIAAMLGPLASFPCVEDPRNVYPTVAAGWLLDVPVMCTSGNLLQACAQFHKPRPVGDVRHSPWVDGRAVLAQRRLCPRTTPRLG
jgi:hypothetical protein